MEAYANDACRTVVAQVTEAVGFQAMTQSTVDTLADVLASYIEEVGYQSHCLTEVSNRTHDNALDTRQALLQCGTTIVDLQRFMGRNELRYAKAEVAFPVQRPPLKASMMLRFGAEQGEHLPHIPDFLPSLPPQHSYKASVKQTGSRADARVIKKQKHKEHQQIEHSLHKMAASASGKASKKRQAVETFAAEADAGTSNEGPSVSAEDKHSPQVDDARSLNDMLADAADTLSSLPPAAALSPERGEEQGVGSMVPKVFSVSLPSKEALVVKEAESRAKLVERSDDRDRDKKRMKATRILSTSHLNPNEEETARGAADVGGARSPVRSPMMDSPAMDD
jgi:hypothetical protein